MGAFTNIPFPDVPNYPGVPVIPRLPSELLLTPLPVGGTSVAIVIASLIGQTDAALAEGQLQIQDQNALAFQNTQYQTWGIFGPLPDSTSQVGIISGGGIPSTAVLSTFSVEFERETRVSDFPLEAPTDSNVSAAFATYNKVTLPANPKVVCILEGTSNDRAYFLDAIETACLSTNLYVVSTPEYTFYGYTLESYSYSRKAEKGAVLLMVEISLKEVRQVSAAFGTAASPINSPQDPAAAPQVNNGNTAPATVPQSILYGLNNKPQTAVVGTVVGDGN